MDRRMKGRALAPGAARGVLLRLSEPLSLWGGLDPEHGTVIEAGHPQRGAVVSGRVLAMPAARGSSSSSSVLAEATRLGSAPAAILLAEPDSVLAVGALVGEELYGVRVPVVLLAGGDLAALGDGDTVMVTEEGEVQVVE